MHTYSAGRTRTIGVIILPTTRSNFEKLWDVISRSEGIAKEKVKLNNLVMNLSPSFEMSVCPAVTLSSIASARHLKMEYIYAAVHSESDGSLGGEQMRTSFVVSLINKVTMRCGEEHNFFRNCRVQ